MTFPTFRKISLAEVIVAIIGLALLLAALRANQAWFDRHFLPSFFTPREEIVQTELHARIAVAVAGLVIALVLRKSIARFMTKDPVLLVAIAVAIILACGAAELVLRRQHIRSAEEIPRPLEPLRHLDARLGWLFDSPHTGRGNLPNVPMTYTFDRNGYRVATPRSVVDFDAPTIIFTGESMIVGENLDWSETIPAQTGAMLHLQSANIAVSGFATDQAYLRLASELPRFHNARAVVAMFTPSLFDRNLDDDRPHLGPGLVWQPAVKQWRLWMIARRAIGYRSSDDIERGVAVTREVLSATVRLARARGAVPLIVVPEFDPEEPRERELRRRILDEARLPYVVVTVDPDNRIENDGHPDADGAREIATAIASALRPSLGH